VARVVWTESALGDLESIVRYVARDSRTYAERLGTRIVSAPRRLEQFPLSGRVVPEFHDESIRELIYASYRILYLVKEDLCYVLAVIHASRDIVRHIRPGEWIIE